jgi:hypothetical protein
MYKQKFTGMGFNGGEIGHGSGIDTAGIELVERPVVHVCRNDMIMHPLRPPPSFVAGPSNCTTPVFGRAHSKYVGFVLLSGGGISFEGSSSSVDGGFGGNPSGNDGGMNNMRNDIDYGVGESGHGGSGGFIANVGNEHGSSCPTNNISKPSSHIRTSLGFRIFFSYIFIQYIQLMLCIGLNDSMRTLI